MSEIALPNGVHLHWREMGIATGPPIVWIHGGPWVLASARWPTRSSRGGRAIARHTPQRCEGGPLRAQGRPAGGASPPTGSLASRFANSPG
jgi:pimeloyl-ACP methyl ester carboxylesterase